MQKKCLALLMILFFTGASLWAAYPSESSIMRRRVLKSVQEAIDNSLLEVARTSVVQIEQYWRNEDGSLVRGLCKGVLIHNGKYLVSHVNCLRQPKKADLNAKQDKVFFYFANGYIYGAFLKPVVAKSFVYWPMPKLNLTEGLSPAELSVSEGEGVLGQFGYNLSGTRNTALEQEFVFLGKRGWYLGSLTKEMSGFLLKNAFRERQFGEPVFIGRRVIALNGEGGSEGFGLGYPFRRPVFTPFTRDNGGDILQNL